MWPPDETSQNDGSAQAERRGVGEVLGGLLPASALRGPVLFVAAHPDDTVRGAAWLLRRSPGCHVVHVTDGAPRESVPGDLAREAQARRREEQSFAALALAGLTEDHLLSLGAVAEEAASELVTLTECLVALLKALRPTLLVVPPYDGRHPDQDAAAFISHTAVALLHQAGRTPPVLLEALTHAPVPGSAKPGVRVTLGPEERVAKHQMLACFGASRSSDDAGARESDQEYYRRAMPYDFTRPTHEGLVYEAGGARMPRVHWRRLARQALEELRLVQTPWH